MKARMQSQEHILRIKAPEDQTCRFLQGLASLDRNARN